MGAAARFQPCREGFDLLGHPSAVLALAIPAFASCCPRPVRSLNDSIRDGSDPSSSHIRWLTGRSRVPAPARSAIESTLAPGPSPRPSRKNISLLCCERNPDPACTDSSLATQFSFHRDRRPDGVTIAFRAAEAERNRRRQSLHHVLQNAQLRTVAVFQENFQTAIMIEIRQGKRSAVLEEIQSHHAGNIGERSIADCSRRKRFARTRSRCRPRGSVR